MLLNLPDEARRRARFSPQTVTGRAARAGFRRRARLGPGPGAAGRTFPTPSAQFGSVGSVGTALFTTFFYPFEVVSLLLVVAMIGAVLLAKRRI